MLLNFPVRLCDGVHVPSSISEFVDLALSLVLVGASGVSTPDALCTLCALDREERRPSGCSLLDLLDLALRRASEDGRDARHNHFERCLDVDDIGYSIEDCIRLWSHEMTPKLGYIMIYKKEKAAFLVTIQAVPSKSEFFNWYFR